jgi:hypothetical protein
MGTVNDGAIAFVNGQNQIEISVFHPLLQHQKAKRIVRWPVWLLDVIELKNPSSEPVKLARTISEPLDACIGAFSETGIELAWADL